MAVTAAGVLVTVVAGYYLWSTAGRVSLTVGDAPIVNADEMLSQAEDLLDQTAAADGAPLDDEARCFFAPGGGNSPVIMCGPVWLGVSPPEEPWLEVRTSYRTDPVSTEVVEAVGEIDGFRRTTEVDPRTFQRPDGRRPADREPSWPSEGLRLRGGERLNDPGIVLSEAEAVLPTAVAESDEPIRLAENARCFFLQGPDLSANTSLAVIDGNPWCGPARSLRSDTDNVWIPLSVGYVDGPTFGTRSFDQTAARSLRLRELPEGASLIRPDGVDPVSADDLARPARPPDFAVVIDQRLDRSPETTSAGQAVLTTDNYRIDFDSLLQVDRIGSGADSYSASDGHQLVVVTIAPAERVGRPRGVLVVDGAERPLPNWNASNEGGTLIVSVPAGARSVELLVENNGRPQSLSLLDGSLGDGFPLALYREPVELAAPFSVRLAMPVGDAVLVEGSLAQVEWSAKDDDNEWLEPGEAELVFDFDEFKVDRPCCDVRIDDVTARFSLIDQPVTAGPAADDDESDDPAAGVKQYQDLREDPTANPRNRSPRFRVTEDLTAATLRIEVTATFTQDDQERIVVETHDVPLSLPLGPTS